MKNTIGNALTVTLFGESHGEAIGAVLDGLAPGIAIDMEYIRARLLQRRPYGAAATKGESLTRWRSSAACSTDARAERRLRC